MPNTVIAYELVTDGRAVIDSRSDAERPSTAVLPFQNLGEMPKTTISLLASWTISPSKWPRGSPATARYSAFTPF